MSTVYVECDWTGEEEIGRRDLETGQIFCNACGCCYHDIVDFDAQVTSAEIDTSQPPTFAEGWESVEVQ